MPLLTKMMLFRRLNRPRLAHSGWMSSSFNCGSDWCELHVSGGRRGCGRQAPHASHVTPHHHANKRTSEFSSNTLSQVSKLKCSPIMVTPSSACDASLISKAVASRLGLGERCVDAAFEDAAAHTVRGGCGTSARDAPDDECPPLWAARERET